MRVLLVEDNPMNIELFVDTLESDGHTIALEGNGRDGLARALAERFDLVVLDIQLPGMSGDAICRELRAAGVRTPIVALSSAALPEQVARGLAAGFDAYLTKPLAPGALREAVRRHGERGRAA